jgi:hypothetical protein
MALIDGPTSSSVAATSGESVGDDKDDKVDARKPVDEVPPDAHVRLRLGRLRAGSDGAAATAWPLPWSAGEASVATMGSSLSDTHMGSSAVVLGGAGLLSAAA